MLYTRLSDHLARGRERSSVYYVLLIRCGDIVLSDDIQG